MKKEQVTIKKPVPGGCKYPVIEKIRICCPDPESRAAERIKQTEITFLT